MVREGEALPDPVAGLRLSWNWLGRSRALPWLHANFGRGRLRPPPLLVYACHGFGLGGAAPSLALVAPSLALVAPSLALVAPSLALSVCRPLI